MICLVGNLVISIVQGLVLRTTAVVASVPGPGRLGLPWAHGRGLPVETFPALLPFVLAAGVLTCSIAVLMRSLAMRADQRRREADLASELARILLSAKDPGSALPAASQRPGPPSGLPDPAFDRHPPHRVPPPGVDGSPPGMRPTPLGEVPPPRRPRTRMVPPLTVLMRAAHDRGHIETTLLHSRDELRRIAEEQAALRRVATLVARGISPAELFSAVACEMGRLLQADCAAVSRYDAGCTTVVGWWSAHGGESYAGSRWSLDEPSVAVQVLRTGGPARKADYETSPGALSIWAREHGITLSVGCPIRVEDDLWGVLSSCAVTPGARFDDAENRMVDFTELVTTAISNAQARAELAASRARVVAAMDETRRRIERDLHDGAQQRLVLLGLELRAAECVVPPELTALRAGLCQAVQGLSEVLDDLRELSQGIHPAILSKGGMVPALKMLARRCAVPVELDVRIDRHLPQPVEVAIYYVVSEALTNVVKHASASSVRVALSENGSVRLLIQDDGVGGADVGKGSGLISLSDRVETLGGRMTVTSGPRAGTALSVTIPVRMV